MRLSISRNSRARVWIANRSFGWLLGLWVVAYIMSGVVFAWAYNSGCGFLPSQQEAVPHSTKDLCVRNYFTAIYFSFTTQATVGYGDYVPINFGRWLSVAQEFLGVILNATILGLAVFKALRRQSPIRFATYLIYEPDKHAFRFRFLDVDADQLRSVSIAIHLVQESEVPYDTVSSTIEIPFDRWKNIAPLHLIALETATNRGSRGSGIPGDFKSLRVSPDHFSEPSRFPRVEVNIEGFFESTGDRFFDSRIYYTSDIHCGRYIRVFNNKLVNNARQRAKELSVK